MSPARSTASCDPAADLPRQPFPGDLYLDPDVPPAQRVRVGQGRWRAEATHVWTGTGWTRLVAGLVRPVPSAGPAHRRPAPAAVVATAITAAVAGVQQQPTLFDDGSGGGATVVELRPSTALRQRRDRYASLEHRWAS